MNFLDLTNIEAPDQRKTPQWKCHHDSWSLSLSYCLLLCFQRFCNSFKWDSLQLERDKAWALHTYDIKSKMASRNGGEEQETGRDGRLPSPPESIWINLPALMFIRPSRQNWPRWFPVIWCCKCQNPITIHLPAAFLPFFGNTAWRRHVRRMTAMWTLWNAASGLLLCLYCTMEKGTQQLKNTERPNQRGKSIQH